MVEPKLDGCSVAIVYVNGSRHGLATRGDGTNGEDITHNVDLIDGVPDFIEGAPQVLEVRGEVVMTKEQFEEASRNRENSTGDAFKNPRNATAGVLNTDVDKRKYDARMTFFAFDTHGFEDMEPEAEQYALNQMGFTTAEELAVDTGRGARVLFTSIQAAVQAVTEIASNRDAFPCGIDGAVVKVADAARRKHLGFSSRAPKWATAFKFPAERVTTTIEDIEVSVGKSGRMGLRARVTPVDVDGSTVSYATLHNPKFILGKGIAIGDTVTLYKAGDIIPAIDELVTGSASVPWTPPETCPRCDTEWDVSENGLIWKCETPGCSLVGWLTYAASRDVLDIDLSLIHI